MPSCLAEEENHKFVEFTSENCLSKNVLELEGDSSNMNVDIYPNLPTDERTSTKIGDAHTQEDLIGCFECSEIFMNFESFDDHMKSHSVLALID